jgi:hypothetical protein
MYNWPLHCRCSLSIYQLGQYVRASQGPEAPLALPLLLAQAGLVTAQCLRQAALGSALGAHHPVLLQTLLWPHQE